ncbi:hypothetical protein MIT9_P2572 [Methylomarinovum caldicuralii]|uniref:Holin n=1 Tax=Methylomarinovum caldicuralii TaxID=438856 RepID=A0AAU9CMS6_9GAMM|nr:hypothetical protein [Methylomarinovum caldicuralii]BCX82981.1 hypothetical protein MIT9_P2572 [Methylomarinovum caldicuralii]
MNLTHLTTVQKALWSILIAQIVLIVFFGAFKFEKITLFLYTGAWIGIGVAWYVLRDRAAWTRIKVIASVFGVQILAFVFLDLARMNDLLLEEIGFLSIGVWTGILLGTLLETIDRLEKRLLAFERREKAAEEAGE